MYVPEAKAKQLLIMIYESAEKHVAGDSQCIADMLAKEQQNKDLARLARSARRWTIAHYTLLTIMIMGSLISLLFF